MIESVSIFDYIICMFAGWGVFTMGVIVVAFISNLFKKKDTNETR